MQFLDWKIRIANLDKLSQDEAWELMDYLQEKYYPDYEIWHKDFLFDWRGF